MDALRATRHLGRVLSLAAALVVLGFAGAAVARGGNRVHVRVPKHAKLNRYYSISLHGSAAKTERLYLFLDYHGCGANPAVEHARANGDVWIVHGSFNEVAKHWRSSLRGVDHACAYLQRASKPENSRGGIVARASKAYRVH